MNFKVIGLTRPGFETMRFGFEPVTFGFPDQPEWEADTLIIRPARLVCGVKGWASIINDYSGDSLRYWARQSALIVLSQTTRGAVSRRRVCAKCRLKDLEDVDDGDQGNSAVSRARSHVVLR